MSKYAFIKPVLEIQALTVHEQTGSQAGVSVLQDLIPPFVLLFLVIFLILLSTTHSSKEKRAVMFLLIGLISSVMLQFMLHFHTPKYLTFS